MLVLPALQRIPRAMNRLMRPCLAASCPSLAGKSGYCARHTTARNLARRGEKRVYESAQHQAWRQVILIRDPVCVECKTKRSVIADHIQPLSKGGTWDYSNGRGVCRSCDGKLGAAHRFAHAV